MANSGTFIIYNPGTPKIIKENVNKLAKHSPKLFKEILLSDKNCLSLIKHFKSCNFQTFYVHKTEEQEPLLLRYVCSIDFPCLKILHLEKVRISSFEALHWINSPHLMMLHLMDNVAISVKSLAKTKFTFIVKLELDSKISHCQMSRLTRMRLKPDTVVKIQADSSPEIQSSNEPSLLIIESMIKMETKNFFAGSRNNIRAIDIIWEKVKQRKYNRMQE